MKIQTLELHLDAHTQTESELTVGEPRGFWRRQFQQETTPQQRSFDWTYGVVVPLICFAADPIVFTETGLLAPYRPFAYTLSSTSILAMVAWLLWGQRVRWLAAPLGGFFIAGSAVSFIVGAMIFPYSLLGLLVLIGFLGFTPLFSGLVFLRNGIRALRTSNFYLEPRIVWQSAVLAAMFSLVIAYLANIYMASTPGPHIGSY